MDARAGLLITDASFKPSTNDKWIPILKSASLAQIDVLYDDGKQNYQDFPAFGKFASRNTLNKSQCNGRIPIADQSGARVLCAQVTEDGFRSAWTDYDFGTGNHFANGQCLQMYTVTPVDWYTYTERWSFCDDGAITPAVGAGGLLDPRGSGNAQDGQPAGPNDSTYAIDHYHNYFWRLQFSLGTTPPFVNRVSSSKDEKAHVTKFTRVKASTAAVSTPNEFWNIRSSSLRNTDGHSMSYDIEAYNSSPDRSNRFTFLNYDIYTTNANNCEMIASNNKIRGCPDEVDKYGMGSTLADPVLWVQESFHHLPRDEDQPEIDEHWTAFDLMPRDLTASNPLLDVPNPYLTQPPGLPSPRS